MVMMLHANEAAIQTESELQIASIVKSWHMLDDFGNRPGTDERPAGTLLIGREQIYQSPLFRAGIDKLLQTIEETAR